MNLCFAQFKVEITCIFFLSYIKFHQVFFCLLQKLWLKHLLCYKEWLSLFTFPLPSRLSSLVQYQSPACISGFHVLSEGHMHATSEHNRVERVGYTHYSWCNVKNNILTSHQGLPLDFRLIKKAQGGEVAEPVFGFKPLSSWREPGEDHGRQYKNPISGRAGKLLPEIFWKEELG